MSLKIKIVLSLGLISFVTILLIGLVSIISIKTQGEEDLKTFEIEELKKGKERLKDIVDVVYNIVEANHLQSLESGGFVDIGRTLEMLAAANFDDGNGYFWITDQKTPYPMMIMNGKDPQMVGKVLTDSLVGVVGKDQINPHRYRVEQCKVHGNAFLEYPSYDSLKKRYRNKFSYSRLFPDLGWIVSSSIYTDTIDEHIQARSKRVRSHVSYLTYLITIISFALLLFGIWFTYYFSDQLVRLLNAVSWRLRLLAEGKEVKKIKAGRNDEIGGMAQSLNELISGLKEFAKFTKEIGSGNIDFDFKPLSEGDVAGNELLKMRESLKIREQDDILRNWKTDGMAMFNALFRQNDDLDTLCEKMIFKYVTYMSACQGGIFLIEGEEEEEKHLALKAAYAFDRQKYVEKRVNIGEGILGQSVLEKTTKVLKKVPTSFIHIKSGLGDAPPSCVLVTPIISGGEVFGVIEIASFKAFKDYEVEFSKQLCEGLASVISTIKTNEVTKKLLKETQVMSSTMKEQEEAMMRNMEELSGEYEEVFRQQNELMEKTRELEEENTQLKEQLKEIQGDS